jgi:cadmium resistance protein CadD (predicted permease)
MADKGIDFRLEFGQRMTALTAAVVLAVAAMVLHCFGLVSEGIVLGAFGMITTIAGLLQVFRGKEKQQAQLTRSQLRQAEADERVAELTGDRPIGFGGE